jgi:type I restriction enzyme S subunit
LLVTIVGTVGETAIVPNSLAGWNVARAIAVLPIKSEIGARWVKWALLSPTVKGRIQSRLNTTVQATLNLGDLAKLPILVPPPSQRYRIEAILGALDDKIDLNRRMNETLEAMARETFKDWFVDFGPTRAKMEGRESYLASELWALFPDRLDEEGKPEGWKIGSLNDVADITMGASPDGSTYNDRGKGMPLVNGPVEYGDFFLRRIKWTTAPNKMSRRGDLILCVRGSTTGRHAFADGDYCLGRGVCSIRGIGDLQEFVDGCVLVHLDRLLQKTTGSVFPNLSGDDIRKLDVLIPADDVRKAYCETVRPFRDQVWANVVQSETLAFTRDLLLPKLMSGEIQLRDAEKPLEAVA